MVAVLWAHVFLLPIFAVARGFSLPEAVGWTLPIQLAGIAGMLPRFSHRSRSVAIALGLLTASAVLVHASGGRIEAHFHFFVMIALLALYEDWLPFGVAIFYVVVQHGVVGVLAPHAVYDHGGNAWMWAGIHGAFVLAAATANVATWRLNEDMRVRMDAAHREAHEVNERFRLAFETGVTGMALVAPDGRFLRVNRSLCEMVGYSEEELLARGFQSITREDHRAADAEHHRSLLAGTSDSYETEKAYVHRDGYDVWIQLGVSAVRDGAGNLRYFVSQMHDVTERRRFADELAHQALHDPLTGLPNRALFLDRLRHALVRLRRHPGEVCVLFVDLDRFKTVNDGLGHGAGDLVLVEAAKRLCEAARAEDTVARFGGDEFTILCENTPVDEGRQVAERVQAALAAPILVHGRELHLSASVGLRACDLASGDPDGLLRDADVAMYAAKELGGARLTIFDAALRNRTSQRLELEEELRVALRDDQLTLHYQPAVDLLSGRFVVIEALVRWEHPERGLLAPTEFIPAAEENGLIVPIGEWVLREACTQLRAWQRSGLVDADVKVAVNVSARQLSRPELPQTVDEALEASELDPRSLCVEITESAIIDDTTVALRNINTLKARGIVIALDDFGVGFSSLSQIRELPPVDVIKIDRSFTAGLGDNGSDDAVVHAVLGLARSLGLAAVAEGVETTDQLAELQRLGCEVGQGFYFSRPQPPHEVQRVLAAGPQPLPDVDDVSAPA